MRRVLGHKFFKAFFTKDRNLNYFIEILMALDKRAEFNRRNRKLVCTRHINFVAQLDIEK